MMMSNIQKPGAENACDNHCNDTGFALTESRWKLRINRIPQLYITLLRTT